MSTVRVANPPETRRDQLRRERPTRATRCAKGDQSRGRADVAIAAAVASLRDIADRLETGPRQRAAELLMRESDAIEELRR